VRGRIPDPGPIGQGSDAGAVTANKSTEGHPVNSLKNPPGKEKNRLKQQMQGPRRPMSDVSKERGGREKEKAGKKRSLNRKRREKFFFCEEKETAPEKKKK